MSFQLVPKSVTLNNLEWYNAHIVCVTSPNLVAFGAHYIKLVNDLPLHSASVM